MAKTKPHTVRFEEEEYEFLCKREGLKTAQSILKFFMKEYMKLYKVEKPSVFQQEKELKFTEPKEKVVAVKEEAKLSQFEAYVEELKSCSSIHQVRNIIKQIEIDDELNSKEKSYLKDFAQQIIIDNGIFED